MLLECCNKLQKAKTLILPNQGYMWRELVYLEECEKCHSARAVMHIMRYDGILLTPHKWSGETATKKYNKYLLESRELIKKVESGTKSRMQWLYCNGNNTMYDFNNKKRSTFDDNLTVFQIQA